MTSNTRLSLTGLIFCVLRILSSRKNTRIYRIIQFSPFLIPHFPLSFVPSPLFIYPCLPSTFSVILFLPLYCLSPPFLFSSLFLVLSHSHSFSCLHNSMPLFRALCSQWKLFVWYSVYKYFLDYPSVSVSPSWFIPRNSIVVQRLGAPVIWNSTVSCYLSLKFYLNILRGVLSHQWIAICLMMSKNCAIWISIWVIDVVEL